MPPLRHAPPQDGARRPGDHLLPPLPASLSPRVGREVQSTAFTLLDRSKQAAGPRWVRLSWLPPNRMGMHD
jgi:hypothetical protein